jgi:hypothetical protein
MMTREFAVHKSQRPVRFAQVVLAFGLTFVIADPPIQSSAVRLQSIPTAPRPVAWVKFDTDACGSLAGVESRRSLLMTSSETDENGESGGDGEGDEDNWLSVWGMSAEASARAQEWILEHPQVAIVSDAIDKSCDDNTEDGDSDTFEIA